MSKGQSSTGGVIKGVLVWSLTAVQALLVGGILLVDYTSNKYMGMYRYILSKNRTWGAELPLPGLILAAKVVLWGLSLAAVLFLVVTVARNRSLQLRRTWHLLALFAIAVGVAVFMSIRNVTNMRTYYFVVLFLLAIVVIQFAKVLLSAWGPGTRRSNSV